MVYTAGRVRLFVDGKQAADQAITAMRQATARRMAAVRPPMIWRSAVWSRRDIGCDGLIDDVRISQAALDIKAVPQAPLALEDASLGLWRFDALDQGRFADIGRLNNPARPAAPVVVVEEPNPVQSGPLPTVDKRTSLDWRNVGNDKGGMRYSTLKQINRANVQNLQVAWTYHGGDASPGSTIECTPVVVDGVMYVTTSGLKISRAGRGNGT